jgi:multicomponent Na+:H+ antiporter subunit C
LLESLPIDYWLTAALLLIALYGLIASPNLLRKLMALNMLQSAVIVFFIQLGAKSGAAPPIAPHGGTALIASAYVNPLPQTLMLTAIVVGVATTGVALALLIGIHRRFGTLDEAEILERLRKHPRE